MVEGKTLLQRGSIEKLRDQVTDLQLTDGVRGIVSLFSAREPPQGSELPAPLFPEQLPKGAEYGDRGPCWFRRGGVADR